MPADAVTQASRFTHVSVPDPKEYRVMFMHRFMLLWKRDISVIFPANNTASVALITEMNDAWHNVMSLTANLPGAML